VTGSVAFVGGWARGCRGLAVACLPRVPRCRARVRVGLCAVIVGVSGREWWSPPGLLLLIGPGHRCSPPRSSPASQSGRGSSVQWVACNPVVPRSPLGAGRPGRYSRDPAGPAPGTEFQGYTAQSCGASNRTLPLLRSQACPCCAVPAVRYPPVGSEPTPPCRIHGGPQRGGGRESDGPPPRQGGPSPLDPGPVPVRERYGCVRLSSRVPRDRVLTGHVPRGGHDPCRPAGAQGRRLCNHPGQMSESGPGPED